MFTYDNQLWKLTRSFCAGNRVKTDISSRDSENAFDVVKSTTSVRSIHLYGDYLDHCPFEFWHVFRVECDHFGIPFRRGKREYGLSGRIFVGKKTKKN